MIATTGVERSRMRKSAALYFDISIDIAMLIGIVVASYFYGAVGSKTALIALVCFVGLLILRLRLHDRDRTRSAEQLVRRDKHNAHMETALNSMSQGLCMFDAEKRLIVCNTRYAELYRLSSALVKPGTHFRKIVESRIESGLFAIGSPAEYIRERLTAVQEETASVKIQELTDGRTIAIWHCPTQDGGWVATHDDITEIRRVEARMAHLAHHDALTGLPNRIRFRQELDSALAQVRRGGKLAVLCLDLDHFKEVNDSLGHPMGDSLLREVSDRLYGQVRETDIVARLGGDEFAIVSIGLKSPDEAGALAGRVIKALSSPYEIEEHQVLISASVGIALAPTDSGDADQLLRSADMALYRAKTDGRGVHRFFEPGMDVRMQERRALELDLRRALTNREFEIRYQPLVNTETDRIVSLRGVDTLAPPCERHDLAREVHPARRRDRVDRKNRFVGAKRSMQGGCRMAIGREPSN